MRNCRYRSSDPDAGCEQCGGGFEVLQTLSAAPLERCPGCEASVRRVIGRAETVTNPRWAKKTLSDGNLKRLGFKKLVKESDGKYRDV